MPSETVAPVQIAWVGGSITTNREIDSLIPARIVWGSGSVAEGPGAGVNTSVTAPDLDNWTRFDRPQSISESEWTRWMARDQAQTDAIEAALKGLTGQVGDLTAIVNRLAAAESLAAAANDNAADTRAAQDLADSYTDPPSVLSASNAGEVMIAAHERVYPISGARVSITGGSVSGFASGDYATIFYPDAARQGGSVAFQGSKSPVAQQGATHVVGQVLIPDAGEPPAPGVSPSAPGYTPPRDGRELPEYDLR